MSRALLQNVFVRANLFGDPLGDGWPAAPHSSAAAADSDPPHRIAGGGEAPVAMAYRPATEFHPGPTPGGDAARHAPSLADWSALAFAAPSTGAAPHAPARSLRPPARLAPPATAVTAAPMPEAAGAALPPALVVPPATTPETSAAPAAPPAGGGGIKPLVDSPPADTNRLEPIIVVAGDAGTQPLVKVFDPTTGQEKFQFLAYDPLFRGGVRVAAADLNGDGIPDIITVPGPGMPVEVKTWDGTTGAQFQGPVGDFIASSFQGGAFVAAGDVNGDGAPDIIVGPGPGGGSTIRTFSGTDARPLGTFAAYGAGYQAGVPVAADDWPGVGHAYVVAGSGPGSGEVRLLDAQTGAPVPGPLADLHPFGTDYHGGVWVATGDLNGDGTSDLLAGAGLGHTPEVKAYSGADGSLLQDFLAGDTSSRTGVVPLTGIDAAFSLKSSRGNASSLTAGVPAAWEASCPTTSPSPTPGRPRPSPAPRRHPTARFRAASTSTVRPLRPLPPTAPSRRAA
jgi:hypothetical protein